MPLHRHHEPDRKDKAPHYLLGPWLPRKRTRKGRLPFVMLDDWLMLALLDAGKRVSPAAYAVLWAITWKVLSQFHKVDVAIDELDAVAISVDELCQVTGFTEAAVYRALKRLEDCKVITRVASGGGRGQKNFYGIHNPEAWSWNGY
jgi:hypothetical protein